MGGRIGWTDFGTDLEDDDLFAAIAILRARRPLPFLLIAGQQKWPDPVVKQRRVDLVTAGPDDKLSGLKSVKSVPRIDRIDRKPCPPPNVQKPGQQPRQRVGRPAETDIAVDGDELGDREVERGSRSFENCMCRCRGAVSAIRLTFDAMASVRVSKLTADTVALCGRCDPDFEREP